MNKSVVVVVVVVVWVSIHHSTQVAGGIQRRSW